MAEKSKLLGFQHPLALTSLRIWLGLLRQNRGVDRAYLGRAALITVISLLTSPLRWYEHLRYDAPIKQFAPSKPPIFIIGHWRSGTTHLHNLLCQDQQFGYITTIQTLVPEVMFAGHSLLDRLFGGMKPSKRPMDNMLISLNTPQEEEMALAALSLTSSYHQWWFPRHAGAYFERYGLQRGISAREARRWRETYRWLLQKLTVRNNGRQILLKNPANTGRVKALMEAFPGAKFIHIHRNPYEVFVSTQHLYRTMLPSIQLQTISQAEIDRNILQFYESMMSKLADEQQSIPAGDFAEVRFEDLEADPLGEVQRVYETLRLPGFEAAQPAIEAYAATLTAYRKNSYDLDAQTIEQVNQHWRFAFERWGYPLRSA